MCHALPTNYPPSVILLGILPINDEASDRVLGVEQEYNKKRRPLYRDALNISLSNLCYIVLLFCMLICR
jgi:hypothetical protein